MNRKEMIIVGIVLLGTFVTGVFAAPSVQQVFVSNFPLDSKGSLRTSGNVTVVFPSQTSSIIVIPFNSTATSAISFFPNFVQNVTTGNMTTVYRSLTLNLTQWREFRPYPQAHSSRSITVAISCSSFGCNRPSFNIFGCFRLPGFGSAGSCLMSGNFVDANFAIQFSQSTFSNSTGTFATMNLIAGAQHLDNVQGQLLDIVLGYNSVALTSGILDVSTLGLGLYLRR